MGDKRVIADTTFLIDLQREARGKGPGPANQFLARHQADVVSISVVTVMEFEEGFETADLDRARRFLQAFPVIEIGLAVARRAGRVRRQLRQRGALIPDNDLLIAATALEGDRPVITRNPAHFSRIEGLIIVSY